MPCRCSATRDRSHGPGHYVGSIAARNNGSVATVGDEIHSFFKQVLRSLGQNVSIPVPGYREKFTFSVDVQPVNAQVSSFEVREHPPSPVIAAISRAKIFKSHRSHLNTKDHHFL